MNTLDALRAAVRSFTKRTDLADSDIDLFVALAEARFNLELRHPQQDATVTATAQTAQTITLPDDFGGMRSLHLTILGGDVMLGAASAGARSIDAGVPAGYVLGAGSLTLDRAPIAAYDYALRYWRKVPALNGSNTTNWLLTLAPQAYLFAVLVEAAAWMLDEERSALWQARATAEIERLNAEAWRDLSAPSIDQPEGMP